MSVRKNPTEEELEKGYLQEINGDSSAFVIIGEVVNSDGNVMKWNHAVATRDGFMLDPDKTGSVPLTKELKEKTLQHIDKAYLHLLEDHLP